MFGNLPRDIDAVKDWSWEQFEPYAQDLLDRRLNEATLTTWMIDWSRLHSTLMELRSRLFVARSVDTTDKEADQRFKTFMADIFPRAIETNFQLGKKLIESGLEPENFAVPMRDIRADVELFREENLPLITQESELGTEYDKIIGAQTVTWDGEEVTLRQLAPVYQQHDRDRREKAGRLAAERQLQDRVALNDLWTRFMTLRKQMAANAGFEDYRAFKWKQLGRFDYTPDEALAFCEAIEAVAVPAAERLREKRRAQLGYDTLRPWDMAVDPLGRDPLRPFQTGAELANKAETIFMQVDPQLGGYFKTMNSEGLLDLDNRKGKAPGGYHTSFPLAQRSFIFMNAVGISGDVRTILHEAGHAFHNFERSALPYIQQQGSPMEFNEVASMAMELIAAPYLDSDGAYYNTADAARARIEHLEKIIQFWPYMATIVAFQHWVYTHHDEATDPTNCDKKWRELWDRFMKGIDFSGLEQYIPNRWRQQLHVYRVPFYYIEYGLAQLGAVQVWAAALLDQPEAIQKYREALALGGTAKLPDLYATAGARLAFDAITLQRAIDLVEKTIAELEGQETPV